MNVTEMGVEAASIAAAIHEAGFAEEPERAWSEREFSDLLALPATCAFLSPVHAPRGLLLAQCAAGEAEILTLAVIPAARRHGVARALIDAAKHWATVRGAHTLFLEVAADNAPARALYEAMGFAQIGVRPGYFSRSANAVDALVLSLQLASAPGQNAAQEA